MESNHLPIGYQPIARPESFAGMEPGVGIELTYPVYKTSASPLMLTRHTWSQRRESNPKSAAYRAAALPLSYTGWSRSAGSNRGLGDTSAPFFPLNYYGWSECGESNSVGRTGNPALNQ